MKRFRFTLLAVCLVLFYLGWSDVSLFLRNQSPHPTTIVNLEEQGAHGEWLHISGGYQDLENAISTSGSIEVDALLVPLKSDPEDQKIRILVETRDPHILELFTRYHFMLDSVAEQEAFRKEHAAEFQGQRDVTGMLISGFIAEGNRNKLLKLAQEVGLPVSEDVLFVSEGKEPASIRGFFFLGSAVLGLLQFVKLTRKARAADIVG